MNVVVGRVEELLEDHTREIHNVVVKTGMYAQQGDNIRDNAIVQKVRDQ